MKNFVLKSGLCLLVITLLVGELNAQRQSKRRTGNTVDTTGKPINQVNNVNTQPGFDPYANLPITYDSIGMSDTAARKSLRNDNAFDKSNLTARTPLQYENLRWDDALYAEKVWRELDLREKMNQTFRFEGVDDNGSQNFITMLLRAVNTGQVTAFSPTDDRFTTPITPNDVNMMTAGGVDTNLIYAIDDPDKVVGRRITKKTFDPKTVVKLRIKEEWVFDREASRMFVRILGIAPLKTEYLPNGQERGSSVMFWVYYPDLRPMLAKTEVYNPKNMGQSRMTWEELFESRMFSSYIVKSTLDNPTMKNLRQLVDRKDPILALLEGDNVKEKIFNYEQDLWSY